MTCSHAIFRELTVSTVSSLIVTVACAHCLHSWLICDAQHCVAGERPRLSHLPAGVASLQVEQNAPCHPCLTFEGSSTHDDRGAT